MKTKFIAIGSTGRAGKDTLAQLIKDNLLKMGFSVSKKSLAEPLKHDCDEFLTSKFGISAFTENTGEKNIIRPFLVTVGKMRRISSEGTYFTKFLSNSIESSDVVPEFIVVPDLRYDEYPEDELFFFKKNKSFIINLSRIDENNRLIPPANEDEANNCSRIARAADLDLVWPTYNTNSNAKMVEFANFCTTKILEKFNL